MRRFSALLALALSLGACTAEARPRDQRVEVTIEYSRFEPSGFEFPAGTTVTFEVTNTDPIDHEFIVGDRVVQDRHEAGKHARHGSIPGEISVPAGTTRTTTFTFARPGRLLIGCHLPNHFAYGMRAVVEVT